jgi:dipeptidyl aminopeptidase/acylaminoacyl peptidase
MRTVWASALGAALLLWAPSAIAAEGELPPLIPRELLFGNPERMSPKLSPDGTRIAWVAPDERNVLQVWVRALTGKDERAVTADKKRGIRQFFWSMDGRNIVYLQDKDGDEDHHLFGVELESGNVRDLTPFQGVRAEIVATSHKVPNQILAALNLRDRKLMEVYRINLDTGALELEAGNPGDVLQWVADDDFNVRAALVATPEGGKEILLRKGKKGAWRSHLKVGPEDELTVYGFTKNGKGLYLGSSLDADTTRVVLRTPRSRKGERDREVVLAQNPKVDVSRILFHPHQRRIQAAAFDFGRSEWTVLDRAIRRDFSAIRRLAPGDFTVMDRDLADRLWLVRFTEDRGPVRYYLYDRAKRKGTLLINERPQLDGLPLAEMKAITVTTRDWIQLPGYITTPVGIPARDLPMVLLVHGGPWLRDFWGYHPTVQWLANRGYAVLQINYRGSSGFGKRFLHAGDKQWGLKMQDDLVDAVQWAVNQGIANPRRVAIMGGSYGGYAALAAAAFTPDVFRCAVDTAGPVNLLTLLRALPPYWSPLRATFDQRVGNIDDPMDAELLKRVSPLYSAERIKIPLLIGQGANDKRVRPSEVEEILTVLDRAGRQAIYVLYPDEGHGFVRPENRIDFNGRTEAFLAEHLGGRSEPLLAERHPGSTAVVRAVGDPPPASHFSQSGRKPEHGSASDAKRK